MRPTASCRSRRRGTERVLPTAIPDGKKLRTFPGIGLVFPQFRTENRCALFLELYSLYLSAIPDGKPLRTFPGIVLSLFVRNSGRKTAAHFSWNCTLFICPQFRTENRCALFLELYSLYLSAIPDGKPLRTFPGIVLSYLSASGRKTAAHFSWNCFSRAACRPPSPASGALRAAGRRRARSGSSRRSRRRPRACRDGRSGNSSRPRSRPARRRA